MKKYNCISEYCKKLQKKLPQDRYEHSLGVAYTAAALAMRYDPTLMNKALIAGILHDNAKYLSGSEIVQKCLNEDIPIASSHINVPSLAHADLGTYLAKEKYDIHDTEILDAILYHVNGRAEMTLLDKIIFVADYIEPGRDKAPNLDNLRLQAFQNIDTTVLAIMKQVLSFLQGENHLIDPTIIETITAYENNLEQENT